MIFKLLKLISIILKEKDIPYMLSGGLALNAYSIPRMTLDIDLVVLLNEENLGRFLSAFGDRFYLNTEAVRLETAKKGMFNVIDNETGFKIDFIIRKNTEYRITEFERRREAIIADLTVWLVSPEDLVISKIEWIQLYQSEKQMDDIRNLLLVPDIDISYIKYWCKKLKLKTFNLIENA